ncbi:MAG TPA: thiamine pyrophosphate-dependent enzyme, partial [Vicinamibacterales bacterium]|nr:thiamine pyrophosphate-dependent enzyme [Vicinamibacterales bacterium]
MAVTAPGRAHSSVEGLSSAGVDAPVDNDTLLRAYRCMLLSRKLDDKEILLKKQTQTFFQISGAGHEAILVAAGMTLKAGYDWFYPYYRDRALCLQLGMTPLDMLLAAVGAKDDPNSGGRQMPSHWGMKSLHIVSGSSATGMKALHAVGSGEASVIFDRVTSIPDRHAKYHDDEVVYVSVGDGTTSEGEFWEAINAACLRHLPLLFLIEDNGYAISVPVEAQTPGGDISRLLRPFPGLHVDSVDGTDFVASLSAMREAVAYVRARKGPAVVHAHVTRPYAHSYTDDETLYKTPAEREAETRRDPIKRMADHLVSHGIATEADLTAMLAEIEAELNDAANKALEAPKPARSTATQWVYSPDVDPTSSAFDTPSRPEGKPETMVSAINRTLRDEMARDPRIVVFGEDVADASRHDALKVVTGKGGVFKLTHGLQRQFGDDRVFNTPI